MAEIRIDRVTKLFKQVHAVDDVSLTVADGEFMVLLGPSGCGKTTLLRSVAGLEQIDGGRIVIGGKDVTDLPPRKRNIAMVFQSYAVFPHMTVFENIAFGLRMRRAAKGEIGSTTIYVTHDQVEAMSMGDLVAVMRAGKLVQVSDPLTIYDSPVDRFVGGFIGNPPMNFLPARAERRDGGRVAVLEDVGEVRVAGDDELDGPVLLGIRAENI